MRLGRQEEGHGRAQGPALQRELVVESGGSIVTDYQTEKASDPTEVEQVAGLGDDAFVKDLDLHVLVGDRVVSVELHNYRYPEPLTQEQIQQKEQDAAQIVLGRLT